MISETYPAAAGASDRRKVTYLLDRANRISSVSTAGANVSAITYAAHGGLSQETLGYSVYSLHTISYNTRLQPSEIKLSTQGTRTTIKTLDLVYDYGTTDNNGNVKSISYGAQDQGLYFTQNFSYDALNRLANATETNGAATNWSQTNAYDRYGNRQIDYGGGNYNLSFNSSNNRITASGFSYDSARNLTTDTIHTYSFAA